MPAVAQDTRGSWVFARAGATKVRLTGGEPTLRRDLTQICGAIAALPGVESVGVTTNGINLLRKEGAGALLDNLVDAGLTSVNLSLDSLDATKFAALTRRPGKTLDRVLRAVDACAAHATLKTKVNCVVMRGAHDDELGVGRRLGRAVLAVLALQPPAGDVQLVERGRLVVDARDGGDEGDDATDR